MPQPAELASTAAMVGFIFAGLRLLRATQPGPNPAIEAREAREAASAAAEAALLQAGAPTLTAVPAPEDRRENPLPFVGQDRRADRIAQDAAAWRRSA